MSSQESVFIIAGHDDHVTLPVSPTDLVSTVIDTLCTAHGLDPTKVALFLDNARLPADVPFRSCVAPGERVIVDEADGSDDDEEEDEYAIEEEDTDVPAPGDASGRVEALQAVFGDRYPREVLERALRVAHWQPDRAFDIIESGQVPDKPIAYDYGRVGLQTPALEWHEIQPGGRPR
jgi:hypothetical protein